MNWIYWVLPPVAVTHSLDWFGISDPSLSLSLIFGAMMGPCRSVSITMSLPNENPGSGPVTDTGYMWVHV